MELILIVVTQKFDGNNVPGSLDTKTKQIYQTNFILTLLESTVEIISALEDFGLN
jgi:hypothetical protein